MPTDIRYIKNGEALNEDVIARPMEDIEANLTEIFKAGVPKWFSGTTYEANSYTRVGDDIYVAKRQNLNKSPLNNPNDWVLHEGNRQATASDRGTVTISDSTTSNSTITAASSKAAKTLQDDVNTRAYKATTINTGDGLNGGGNLGSNRTFSVDSSVLRDYHLQTGDYDGVDGRILTVGAFGLGSNTQYIGNASVTNSSLKTGFYGYDTGNGSSGGPSGVQRGSLIHQRRAAGGGETQTFISESESVFESGIYHRSRTIGAWSDWAKTYDTRNSGANSGLDADKLDGQHGSFYQNSSNQNAGTLPVARLSGKYNISISGNADNATEADKLDGQHGSFYQNAGNLNAGTIPHQRLPSATTTTIGAVERSTTAEALVGTPNKFPSADQVQDMFFQYGLGTEKNVTDLNDAVETGIYRFGVGTENAPNVGTDKNTSTAGGLWVSRWNDNAVVQFSVIFFPKWAQSQMFTRTTDSDRPTGWTEWSEYWSSTHQGDGTGMDADKLDGQHGSFYRNASNLNAGTISTARLPMGSGNNLDADTVDGLHASQFIRSDANDTFTGILIGHRMIVGGSDISNSSAALQVNGFQRTGKILLHEMTSGDVPTQEHATLSNVGKVLKWNSDKIWHEGNMGSGSGLDADKLDGLQASNFLRSDADDTATRVLSFATRAEIGNWNGGLRFTDVRSTDGAIFIHGPDGPPDDLLKIIRNGSADYDFYLSGDHLMWHAGNDGSGSGLDADKLDGQEGSFYRNASNLNSGTISSARLPLASTSVAEAGTDTSAVMTPAKTHDAFNRFGLGKTSTPYVDDVDNQNAAGFWGWSEDSGASPTGPAIRGCGLTMITAGGNRQSQIAIANEAYSDGLFYRANRAGSWQAWRKVWHDDNMGSESGLDADTVDGLHADQFIRSDATDTFTGYLTGYKMALGGSPITQSGATLQVNGFQRTGKILLHETDSDDLPTLAADTLENVNNELLWAKSKILREANFSTSANAKGGVDSDSVMTPLRTHEAMGWFGIGTSDARDYTNFNSVTQGGMYSLNVDGSSPVAAPMSNDSAYALLHVSGDNSNNSMQLATVTSRTSTGNNDFFIRRRSQGGWDDWRTLWHDGNHGSGSGLDADKLDGQEGSFYRNASNLNSGTISTNRLPLASEAAALGGTNSTDIMTSSRTHQAFNQYGLGATGSTNDTVEYGNDLDNIIGNRFAKYGTGVTNSPNSTAGTILNQHWNGEQRTQLAIAHFAGSRRGEIYTRAYQNNEWTDWRMSWDDKNHGSGSGLDADLLDGQEGSFYRNAGNLNAGTISSARLSGTYSINITGNAGKVDNLQASQFLRSDTGNDVVRFNNKEGGNFTGDGDICFDHSDGHFVYRTTGTGSNYDGADAYSMMTAADVVAGSNVSIVGGKGTDSAPVTFSVIQGTGSNLDADKLDGQHGGYFLNASNLNAGTVPASRMSGTYSINISGSADRVDNLHASQFLRSDANDNKTGYLKFVEQGVDTGIMFATGNDGAGIRLNNSNGNNGELEFWSGDDGKEDFVFRHYTTSNDGASGKGTSEELLRIGNGNVKYRGYQMLHESNMDFIFDVLFPVGSVVMRPANPGISVSSGGLGVGTWTRVEGRMIMGSGTWTDSRGKTITFSNGDSGGVYRQKLGVNEMPSHRHTGSTSNDTHSHGTYWKTGAEGDDPSDILTAGNGGRLDGRFNQRTENDTHNHSFNTSYEGNGAEFDVTSPYFVADVWLRTA